MRTIRVSFKDIKVGELFKWNGITFEKVLEAQDIFGPYNALSRTAPTGSKVKLFMPNTMVEKTE